ncbi:MAG: hypothetical protein LBO72_08655 [Helicobacteraceae bacterium]|jgi:hypothetical protein|nr:hypothetical protein [Helicobacteraceae bacterium]
MNVELSYSIIPARILLDKTLTAQEKIFAGIILGEIVQKGEFVLSNSDISQMLNMSEFAIKGALKRLYSKGLIKNGGDGKKRVLSLTLKYVESENSTPCNTAKIDQKGCQFDTLVSEKLTKRGVNLTPLLPSLIVDHARVDARGNLNTVHDSTCIKESSLALDDSFEKEKSKQKKERENHELFEKVYQLYPKKTTKKLSFNKWNQRRLWLKADKIAKAIGNYKKTENVQRGFVFDFTKFLDRYEDYVDGIPEGVKAAEGVSEIAEPNKNVDILIAKLTKLRQLCSNGEYRSKLASMRSASLLSAKGGAAFFDASEARAIDELGGAEYVIFGLLNDDACRVKLADALKIAAGATEKEAEND